MNTIITPDLTLNLDAILKLKGITDDEYFQLCADNPDLRIEMNSQQEVVIMPPTGGDTGGRNFSLIGEFHYWAKRDGTGKGFDSSTEFILPSGAKRSPDLSWVKLTRWNALTPDEQRRFPPLCPDFVIELRSPSDSLATLKEKMEEYLENGAQLGWLIDPIQHKVYVYRSDATVEELDDPSTISGEPLLKGFSLDLQPLLH